MKNKVISRIFFALACLAWFTPLIYSNGYLFPAVTPKGLFIRGVLELALPFYLVLVVKRKGLRPDLKNPITVAVLVFLAINLVSLLFGINRWHSFWENYERMGGVWYLIHLSLFYFYILLLGKLNGAYLQWLFRLAIASAAAVTLYGLWLKAGLPGYMPDLYLPQRVSSSFGNPIFFGNYLILPLVLSLFFMFQSGEKRLRYWYGAAALLCLIGIYISATRGAAAGLVVGGIVGAVMFAFNSKFRAKKYFLAAVLVLIAAGTLLVVFNQKLPPDSALGRLTRLSDTNTKSRLLQWEIALEGFKKKPILGVGPENYYYVASKYQTPELYRYDKGWFDKPHNFWLETLATLGLVGVLSLLGLYVVSVLVFLKAYKNGLLSWAETCVLTGGMLAYGVAMAFSFETIATYVMWYAFLAFAGFLWTEYGNEQAAKPVKETSALLVNVVFAVSGIAVLYIFYVTNIATGHVLSELSLGESLGLKDISKAHEAFLKAEQEPFVYDKGQMGVRFANFASPLAISYTEGKSDKGQINAILDDAIRSMEVAVKSDPVNAIFWSDLADLYLKKASLNQTLPDPRAEEAIQKAVSLAPGRVEPLYFLAELRYRQGNQEEANKVIERAYSMAPFLPDTKWRVALMYRKTGKLDEAVKFGEDALHGGYEIKLPQEALWLHDYYVDKQDYSALIYVLQKIIAVDPQNIDWYTQLAVSYARNGQKEEAVETAQKVQEINPAAAGDVQTFIQSLQ